jgi:hypothetical protein
MSWTPFLVVETLCGVAVAILLGLYAYVAYAKYRLGEVRRFVEGRMRHAEYGLQRSAESDMPIEDLVALARKHPLWSTVIQDLCAGRIRLGGSREENERVRALVRACFTDDYRRRLTGRRWSDRMNAMIYIGLFRLEEFGPELSWAAVDDRRTEAERLLAHRTLAALQRREAIELLETRAKGLTDHHIRHVLMRLDASLLQICIGKFDTFAPWVRNNLLDVLRIRNLRDERTLRLFERASTSEDPELRVRALKGIANFGYMGPEAEAEFAERAMQWRTMHWSEKLMASRLMGAVPSDVYPALLEEMLGDSNYAVRQQAMASLMDYPGRKARLERLLASHPDRYARDLAQEMMERYGYERQMA